MTEEDALLSAVRAAPEDAAPRRAYAAWLEGRGDPRAEYLRLLGALDGVEATAPAAAGLLARLHEVQLRQRIDRRWVVLACRGRIARALRAVQAGALRDDWLSHDRNREFACRFDALPVWADMGGYLLLRPDGEVLTLDDEGPPRPQTHAGWRLLGLVSAAEFFPELRPLLPPRPADAAHCPACGGKGVERWRVEGKKGITPCGKCWGLGWLPARPADAAACPECVGAGRRERQFPHAACELPCGACRGRGWLGEDLA
jgi:uncharacterized protein (TIGR02996 family)